MQRQCPECGTKTDEVTCPNDGEMTLVVQQPKTQSVTKVGQLVGGRYRVDAMIGEGGFGAVYRTTHTATGDTLALKVLRTDIEGASDVVARFRQEAKATSRLKHPNTVRVFDFGQMDDGNLFIAMEFLDGRTLTQVMREEGPLAPERLVKIGIQVLKSLSEAHSKGLVHRDIKPDNIFIQRVHGEPDFVRVLDFGIAKSMGNDREDITSTGAVIGTPKYMSPEQARGQPVDARTDIYSLGIILFEGISGVPPFMAETPLAMILRRVTEEAPRVHESIARPTPIRLCDVVLKSITRRVEDRYPSADAFADALATSLDSEVLLPGGAMRPGGSGAGSQTAAYGAQFDGSDATVDVHSEEIGALTGGMTSRVVMNNAGGDDATVAADSVEIQAAIEVHTQRVTAASDPGTVKGMASPAILPSAAPALGAAAGVGAFAAKAADDGAKTTVTPPVTVASAPRTASEPAASGPPAAAATPQHGGYAPQHPQQGVGNKGLLIGGGIALLVAVVAVAFIARQPQHIIVTQAAGQQPAVMGAVPAAAPEAQPAPAAPAAPAPSPAPAAAAASPAPSPAPGVAPVAQATLVIERDPSSAAVVIDGVSIVGDKTMLAPGKHTAEASLTGYTSHQEAFEVAAGETRTFKFSLQREARTPSSGGTGSKPAPWPEPSARPEPTSKPIPSPDPKPKLKAPGELLID